jgi:glutamyl/glutaminyl-tRNA synthetase
MVGISPDETIGKMKIWSLRQSERKPLYRDADQLINTGWAYYAFDSLKH